MATTETPTCGRAIFLPCPFCGEEDASVDVRLAHLGDETADVFHCVDCDAEFSVGAVREIVSKWGKVLAWLATAPNVEGD